MAPLSFKCWKEQHEKNKMDCGYETPRWQEWPTPKNHQKGLTGNRAETEPSEPDNDSDYEPGAKRKRMMKKKNMMKKKTKMQKAARKLFE